MSIREFVCAIGDVVMVQFESVAVRCTVWDVKSAWGRERVLVRPEEGEGQQWVDIARVNRRVGSAR